MKKVVVIGGGTGNFTVLRGLRQYPVELSAIVSMADDGGSTGILRDELGVLPPGDVRQCLVALSDSGRLMRSLFNYRFENGGLQGHSFGNLLLSALEKVTGNFERAVEEAGKILSIKGKVIPITTHQVRLYMEITDGRMLNGEREILMAQEQLPGFRRIFLEPSPKADSHALDEIRQADVILFGPGGLYTSLIPNLLVEGIAEALRDTKAHKIFIVNLVNKKQQTPGFKASHYLQEVCKFTGKDVFDTLLVNSKLPPPELLEKYADEGELIENDLEDGRVITADLLDDERPIYSSSDVIAQTRSYIRHDSHKLAAELMKIINSL